MSVHEKAQFETDSVFAAIDMDDVASEIEDILMQDDRSNSKKFRKNKLSSRRDSGNLSDGPTIRAILAKRNKRKGTALK